MITLERFEISS